MQHITIDSTDYRVHSTRDDAFNHEVWISLDEYHTRHDDNWLALERAWEKLDDETEGGTDEPEPNMSDYLAMVYDLDALKDDLLVWVDEGALGYYCRASDEDFWGIVAKYER